MKNYLKKIIHIPYLKNFFIPSFYFLLLAITSITTAYYIIFKNNQYFYFLSLLVSLVLITIKNLLKQYHDYYKNCTFYLTVITTSIVVIVYSFLNTYNLIRARQLPKDILFTGKIISVKNDRYTNKIVIEGTERNIKIIAFTNKNICLRKDETILIKKKIKKVNTTDKYGLSCKKQGISYHVYLNKNDYKIISKTENSFYLNLRRKISNKIEKIFLLETASFLKAILIGNKSLISKKTINLFKRAGIIHILALSGLHVGIIIIILFKFFYLLRFQKKIIYLVISIAILLYLEITSKPVSLIRATLMIWIYTFIFINNLNKNHFNILFLSAFIILLLTPEKLFTLGFQLSFSATLGIMLFYRLFYGLLPGLPLKIKESLSLSFSAQFFTIPIIAYSLNEINLNGIITNIVAIPLVFVVIILSIMTIIASIVSLTISNYIALSCTYILKLLIMFCQYIADFPGYFFIDNFNNFLLIYLIFILFILQKKYLSKHKALILFTTIFIIITINLDRPNSSLIKKSSELIILRENKELIIHGQAVSKYNSNIIEKQYINHNLKNIYISLTSTSQKSLRDFTRIIKKYPVSRCYINSDFKYSNRFKNFISLLETEKISLLITDPQKTDRYKNEKLFYKCFFNY